MHSYNSYARNKLNRILLPADHRWISEGGMDDGAAWPHTRVMKKKSHTGRTISVCRYF